MKNKICIVFVLIILLPALIVIHFAFSKVYVKDYQEVLGIKKLSMSGIIQQKGEPNERIQSDSLLKLFYNDMIVSYAKLENYEEFLNIEVIDETYQFGRKRIGVGSSRAEVEQAYKRAKKPDQTPNALNVIDGMTGLTFYFNEQDVVTSFLIYPWTFS